MSEILVAETAHAYRIAQLGLHGRAAELALHLPEHGGLWENKRAQPPRPIPTAVSVTGGSYAQVNYGRWIVWCACGEAQVASRLDRRHFCSNCQNTAVGGLWRPVIFPSEADAIEAVLSRRYYDVNRNWHHGETVADLQHENAEHPEEVA